MEKLYRYNEALLYMLDKRIQRFAPPYNYRRELLYLYSDDELVLRAALGREARDVTLPKR